VTQTNTLCASSGEAQRMTRWGSSTASAGLDGPQLGAPTRHPLAAHFRRGDACRDLTETEDEDERRRIMHNIRHPDEYELVVKHCAILCLRDRLTSLRWTSGDNWAAPGVLRAWAGTVEPRASTSVSHVRCSCVCATESL
jgi:hypothetical protein